MIIKEKIKPLLHQKKALSNIFDNHEGIIKKDRTSIVMSCGTGKTLLSMWVHEKYLSKFGESLTILFYPSLFLVNQTYITYKENTILKFNPLVVCSDTAIGENENDDVFELDASEVKYPVTTNIEDIKNYLQDKSIKDKIVFVTYQSSQLVGIALNELNIKADLGIFDEAHKTATANNESKFAFALKDENVPIVKRLFMTATPRHIKFNSDKEENEVFSMNNTELYGEISYEYPMREAINDGIITDYKIMGILIDDKYINSYTNDLKHYNYDVINEAKIKAINEAMNKYNLNKALIFNTGINASKELEKYSNTNIFNKTIKHLDGTSKHSYREQVLQEFRDSEKFVITNARLFTEGVDLPIIDMVALFRNVKSEIDIIQTVGRVQRIDKNNPNKIGYILLPIFVSNIDNIDEEMKTNKDLLYMYEIINTLKENDEQLRATLENKKQQNKIKSRNKHKSFNNKDDLNIVNPNFEIAYMNNDKHISDEYIRQVSEKITYKIEAVILDKREPKHFTDVEWSSFFNEFNTKIGIENLKMNTIYKNINLGNKLIILKAKHKKLPLEQQIAFKEYWKCIPEEIWGKLKPKKEDEEWRELFKEYDKEQGIENLTEHLIWKGEQLGKKLNRLRNKYKSSSFDEQKQMLSFWNCFSENDFTLKKVRVGDEKWKELFVDFDIEFGIENLTTTTIYKNYRIGTRFKIIKTKINSCPLKEQLELKKYWNCIPKKMFKKNKVEIKSNEEWRSIFNEFLKEFGIDNLKPSTIYRDLNIYDKFMYIKSKYIKSSSIGKAQIKSFWDCFPENFWLLHKDRLEQAELEWKELFIAYDNEFGINNLRNKTKYKNKSLGDKFTGLKSKYKNSTPVQQRELITFWDCIPENMWTSSINTDKVWKELFIAYDNEIGFINLKHKTVFKNENLGTKIDDLRKKYFKLTLDKQKELRDYWDCIPDILWKRKAVPTKKDSEWKKLFIAYDNEIGIKNLINTTIFRNENIGTKYAAIRRKYKISSYIEKNRLKEFWDCFPQSVWNKYDNELLKK